jgi:superfamily I DNA/RNA helicase
MNADIGSTVVLHRTNYGVRNVSDFLKNNGYQTEQIVSNIGVDYSSANIKICTMSSVKGLEFENVFIIDLNDDVIPFPPGFSEPNDEYHISTERRLLYTCMTRARKRLWLFSSGDPSRYLSEINSKFLSEMGEI